MAMNLFLIKKRIYFEVNVKTSTSYIIQYYQRNGHRALEHHVTSIDYTVLLDLLMQGPWYTDITFLVLSMLVF